jgi:hypothetical protein
MEATAIRIRMETASDRNSNRRTDRTDLRRLIVNSTGAFCLLILSTSRADIPWPEVVQRLKFENKKLASRPQGHNGDYFVVCTLYYTPMESGFTAERGFDATPVAARGLHGHKYPHDFLRSVKKEGFGKIKSPVKGRNYIRFNGGNSYSFAHHAIGREEELIARFSAAARAGQRGLGYGVTIETSGGTVKEVFGSTQWRILDIGGGLRRWQIDLYWGEDEPLGPGKFMARPRGTTFEYTYSEAKVMSER